MTRLQSNQVLSIPGNIDSYERDLLQKTGMNLAEIGRKVKLARWSGSIGQKHLGKMENLNLDSIKIAIIPVTVGRGRIAGFCEAVKAIMEKMGFSSVQITRQSDVSGLKEAYKNKANVIFMADDNNFTAFNTQKNLHIDNDKATARAYIEALSAMAGQIKKKEVLILGGGKVGEESIKYVRARRADPVCYELNEKKAEVLSQKYNIKCYNSESLNQIAQNFDLILDATPAADIITADMVDQNTYLAAPGVPAGFTEKASEVLEDRLLHDPLQLGVAGMVFAVI